MSKSKIDFLRDRIANGQYTPNRPEAANVTLRYCRPSAEPGDGLIPVTLATADSRYHAYP